MKKRSVIRGVVTEGLGVTDSGIPSGGFPVPSADGRRSRDCGPTPSGLKLEEDRGSPNVTDERGGSRGT